MRKITAIALIIFIAISTLTAQTVRGKVSDENGDLMPGVTIIIDGHNTGKSTDGQGVFRFMHLKAQEYKFVARMIGYETQEIIINLSEGQDEFVHFKLVPNTELEEVEVFGERYKQPEKLDAITRMPLRPSEQIQSISVISEKVIQEQGALTITDVVRNVPGVTLFGSYGGVRESLSTRGYRGVPILKNGVRVDSDFRTGSLASDMQGVESIQVIKGSAAITQGIGNDLGSPGGIINVVTKTPKFINSSDVGIRGGSWGLARTFFDTQAVLDRNRTFAFRLNGAFERSDGFKRLTPSNRIYINPSVEWRPDEKTIITAELDYMDDEKTSDVGTVNMTDINTEALYEGAKNKYYGFGSDRTTNKTMTYAARITRFLTDKIYVRAAFFSSSYKVDQTTSGLKPLSETRTNAEGKKETIIHYENPIRTRSLGSSHRNDKNQTFQLDLVGRDVFTGNIKHTFQVGFDYKNNDLSTSSFGYWDAKNKFITSLVIDEINVYAPQNEISNELKMPDNITWEEGNFTTTTSSNYGLMAQNVTTFNDYLKAIVGLRYSYERNRDETGKGVVTNDAWNPMLGIMVSPIKNINLFGSFTNTSNLRSAANKTEDGGRIGVSRSTQWEAGIKSDWLDNRLRFNLTYFYIMNKNLANQAYNLSTGDKETFYYKAGDLQRQGVETELSGRILTNLQVMLGYAYLKAEYKNSPSYVNGTAPMNAPEHTANAWVQYTINKSVLKGLSIGIGTYYVGERPVNEYSTKFDVSHMVPGIEPFDMPSYITVNAQLGYTYQKITARVFFNNIFDEIGYNSYFRGGYINFIDPRNFATTISYKF